ncbi:uncharacterized protein [Littorina saxatilis]|uniref:uncharacterized protein n=1 Tax=Littorina saxatilis TaxID=31220 RepID=UPI0038B61967
MGKPHGFVSQSVERSTSQESEGQGVNDKIRPVSRTSDTSFNRIRSARRKPDTPTAMNRQESGTSLDAYRPVSRQINNSVERVRTDSGEQETSAEQRRPLTRDSNSSSRRTGQQRPLSRDSDSSLSRVRYSRQNTQISLNVVGPGAQESENSLNGTRESEENSRTPAAGDVRSEDARENDHILASSPDKESEYGSPTRPKPPKTQFTKPTPQRMEQLDRYVLNTPKQLDNFPTYELVQYLLSPTQTELEAAYALYRWVTCLQSKQGKTTPKTDEEEQSEETVVHTLRTYKEELQRGKIDHADMFSLICKCANLETHKVTGKVRFYCPQPSAHLCGTRHATWSAILLPGGWGLVDCALGARSSKFHASDVKRDDVKRDDVKRDDVKRDDVKRSSPRELETNSQRPGTVSTIDDIPEPPPASRNEFDRRDSSRERESEKKSREHAPHNFYFLPPPEMLVTSHLPDNPCWQLLPQPVNEPDFKTSLLIKPQLHYLNVDLVYPTTFRVKDIAEETEVVWRLKGKALRRFAFRLFCISNNGLSCRDLSRYGFLENQFSTGEATLRLIPPSSGHYVCELYGTLLPAKGNEMTHMVSFDLAFAKTITTPLKFPCNERVEWGPGAECSALGLRPISHETGCINVDFGEAEVVFASSRPVVVTQKLLAVEDEGPGTEVPHSTVNFRDRKNKVRILLRIPEAGDYVLGVYVKEESSPGKCQLVCNYLILCDSGIPEVVHPFPSLPYSKLGPTKAFADFNMKVVCPKKSPIVVAPYSGKVTFVFTTPEAADLSCDLHHLGDDGDETGDAGEYVQHVCQSGESVFKARLPEPGDYLFHLYGKPVDGEGHKFLLYSALVECAVPNKDCLPLPRVVPDWRPRVQILAPLRKCLVLGAVAHFAVRAYKVKVVAIVGQSGTQKFVNEDDDDDGEEKQRNGKMDHDDTKTSSDKDMHLKDQQPKDQDKISEDHFFDDKGEKEANRDSFTVTEKSEIDERKFDADVEEAGTDFNSEKHTNRTQTSDKDCTSYQLSDQESSHSSKKSATVKGEEKEKEEVEDDDDEEDDEEEDEGEDGWHVWRCNVKVNREDEGSGVKLYVQSAGSRDAHMVCVSEFEVITERNMAAKLDHQHAVWAAAEARFKVRPDSGHRSHLDDEEKQSAYFLDDEVYLSNPLGDDNSDDGSDEDDDHDDFSSDSEDDRKESSDEERVQRGTDGEDTTTRESLSPNAEKKPGSLRKETKSSRSNESRERAPKSQDKRVVTTTGKQTRETKAVKSTGKTMNDRVAEMKRVFQPAKAYNAPPSGNNSASKTSTPRPNTNREKTKWDDSTSRGEEAKGREKTNKDTVASTKEKTPREEGVPSSTKVKTPREEGVPSSTKVKKKEVRYQEEEKREVVTQRGEKVGRGEIGVPACFCVYCMFLRLYVSADADAILQVGKSVVLQGEDSDREDGGTAERNLRRKLWNACQRRDREAIGRAVTRYNRGGYPPCPDLAEGERLLSLFQLRDGLIQALESKDNTAIREALTEVERHGFAGEMSVICRKAHAQLSPHRVHSSFPALVEADIRTLLEIRSYRCPPEVVHHVVKGVLLLIGVHEGLTKNWKGCRRRLHVLGPDGILRKMVKVKVENIHPEIAARASVLLDRHVMVDVLNAGPGVLAIYKWARGVIARVEELEELEDVYDGVNDKEPSTPASKRRQREIFREQSDASTNASSTASNNDNIPANDDQNNETGQRKGDTGTPRAERRGGNKVTQGKVRTEKATANGEVGQKIDHNKNLRKQDKRVSGNAGHKSSRSSGNTPRVEARKGLASHNDSTSGNSKISSTTEEKDDASKKAQDVDDDDNQTSVSGSSANYKVTQESLSAKSSKAHEDKDASGSERTNRSQNTRNSSRAATNTGRYRYRGQVNKSTNNSSLGKNSEAAKGQYQSQEPANKPIKANGSVSTTRGSNKSGEQTKTAVTDTGVADQNLESATGSSPQTGPGGQSWGEPQEPLRSLSPHKSPLFRPSNKARNKADMVKPRPSASSSRPKTTPTPVLQSTFFFASLVKKEGEEDEEEENNNKVGFFPKTQSAKLGFRNSTSGKTSRSASPRIGPGATTEARFGGKLDSSKPASETGRNDKRGFSDIATPDI